MHLYKWLRLCGEAWPSTAAEVQKHTHDTEYVAPRTPGRNINRKSHSSNQTPLWNITIEESNTFGDTEFKLVDVLVIPNNKLPIVLLFSLVLILIVNTSMCETLTSHIEHDSYTFWIWRELLQSMCMSLDGFWHECMYVTYVNVNVCLWHMFHNMFLAQVCCGVTVFVGGWGVTPTRKSFRFVRACARSGCQVEFELKSYQWLFPFPFCHAEFSLFPCVARRFRFSPCEIEVRSKDNQSEFEVKSK